MRPTKAIRKRDEVSPLTKLQAELMALRRKLRATIRAYAARLEIDLAESAAAVAALKPAEALSRERLHEIRELTTMLRNCKVKPEKGRRKDLRKLDSLIHEVHLITSHRRNAFASAKISSL
jgi:transcription elongation GreA/GreB family factor